MDENVVVEEERNNLKTKELCYSQKSQNLEDSKKEE